MRVLYSIIIVAIAVVLAVQLKELITLVALSYALAYLADKAITPLEKYKIPRWLGFFIVCTVVAALIVLFVVILVPPLLAQGVQLIERFPSIVNSYSIKLQRMIEQVSPGASQKYFSKNALLSYVDLDLIKNISTQALHALISGYSVALTILNIFLLPIITFYFAVDFKQINNSMYKLLPKKHRRVVQMLSSKINGSISAYLQGQTIVALLLAVLYSIGFAAVGVPFWLAVGVLTGLLNVIPYLGTITGILLSYGLLLVDGASTQAFIGLTIVFVVAQLLEGNIITPKIVGGRVGLSPLVVLLAIMAFGSLFGLLGVIIAVPATAALKVIALYLLEKRNTHESILER